MSHSVLAQPASRFYRDELRSRWLDLCIRLEVKGGIIHHTKMYDRLTHYYSHPGRHYHTLEHIHYCLKKFDEVKHLLSDPDAVELAIWFHDAIYEFWTQPNENEQFSASLAIFFIHRLMGLSRTLASRVAYLIENTQYFQLGMSSAKTQDGKFTVDIDLSGFGDTWEVFQKNNKKVASEFEWMPECEYLDKSLRTMKMFRKREPFYLTDYFRERYQLQAYANLDREIQRLEQMLKTA